MEKVIPLHNCEYPPLRPGFNGKGVFFLPCSSLASSLSLWVPTDLGLPASTLGLLMPHHPCCPPQCTLSSSFPSTAQWCPETVPPAWSRRWCWGAPGWSPVPLSCPASPGWGWGSELSPSLEHSTMCHNFLQTIFT